MRALRCAVFFAALVLCTDEALAQRRVRVTAGETKTIGTWHVATDTTLVISTSSGLLSFSARNITRLEQSVGRRPNLIAGVIGAVVGAGIGGVVGCATNSDSYGVFCGGQDDTKVIVGASIGAVAAGFAGLLLFKREQWETLDAFAREGVR
jgi:hypothetical protein